MATATPPFTVPITGRIPLSSTLLILAAKAALRIRAMRFAQWAIKRISFEYRVGEGRWQRRSFGLTLEKEA